MSGILCRIDDNPKLASSNSSSKIGSILTTELIDAFARRVHEACQHLIQPCEREYLLHARGEVDERQLASSLFGRDVHTDDHAQPGAVEVADIAEVEHEALHLGYQLAREAAQLIGVFHGDSA